jgi:S-formylglutathione hydrolase FrmB
MAQLRCDFWSDTLGVSTSMTVVLPEPGGAGRHPFPTLYLLHGLSNDDTDWARNTSIGRYAGDLGLAVVMPRVERSFYSDEAYGRPYWTFLTEELPRVAGSLFHISDRREDTFVAGLSMGGYGALKWALRRPDRFAAAASLSGAVDLAARQRVARTDGDPRIWDRIFAGHSVEGTDDDLFHLLDTVTGAPPLYVCCGADDVLYDDNVRFEKQCRARGLAVKADFGPGDHDWPYWDDRIRDVLAWLPLS